MFRKPAFAVALAVGLTGTTAPLALAGDQPAQGVHDDLLVVAADGSGDYERLQPAIDAASGGETISIRPGTYEGAVVIAKGVTLAGDGPREDIVLTVAEGPILRLVDSDAVVAGLTFSGSSSDGVVVEGGAPRLDRLLFHSVGVPWRPGFWCDSPCDSLTIRHGSTATVRNSTFTGGGGIRVDRSAPLLDGNELTGGPAIMLRHVEDGAVVRRNTVSGALGNGISVYLGDARPSIEGNVVLDAGASGISVGSGPRNEATGYSVGPWPVSGLGPVIRGNTVSGATNGITVASGAEPLIEDNLLFSNAAAIVISDADPTISGNELRANDIGVFVMRGAPRLEGNSITGGHVGLGIGTAGARPILERNRVMANATDVKLMFGGAMPVTIGNEIGPLEIGPVSR